MEKKHYSRPEIRLRSVRINDLLMGSVTNTDGDTDIGYGGGGTGPAYAPLYKPYSVWEDFEEENEY